MIINGVKNHPMLYSRDQGTNWYGLNAGLKQCRHHQSVIAQTAKPVTIKFSPEPPVMLADRHNQARDDQPTNEGINWFESAMTGNQAWQTVDFSAATPDWQGEVDDTFEPEDDEPPSYEDPTSDDQKRTISYVMNLFGYAAGTILALNTVAGGPADEDSHLAKQPFNTMFGVGVDEDTFVESLTQSDSGHDAEHVRIYYREMRRHANDLFSVLDDNKNGTLEIPEMAQWLATMDGIEQFVDHARPGITTGSNGYAGASDYYKFKNDTVATYLGWDHADFSEHTTMAVDGKISYLERVMTNWVFSNTHDSRGFKNLLAPVKKWELNYLFGRTRLGRDDDSGTERAD